MPQPVVSVRGHAQFDVEPEIAAVSITVTAEHTDREAAARLLSERIKQANALVDRFASAVQTSSNRGVQLFPQYEKGELDRAPRYLGRCTFDLHVNDFAVLSDLIVGATEIEASEIVGPWWQLRADSPAYRRARLLAVSDAVTRAWEYAAAFGCDIVSLIEMSDIGMSGSQPMPARGYRAASLADGSSPITFDLEAARQTVSGSIEARFTMTEPDLAGGAGTR